MINERLGMENSSASIALSNNELRTEIVRKSLHFLIALTPSLAALSMGATIALLGGGTLFYIMAEILRLNGREVFLVSRITAVAARPRDAGRFVLGPATLGLGALCALVFYPQPAASIAIYALAFGDGLASLVGRLFGRLRLPLTGGKSLEGSLACFAATFAATYSLTRSIGGSLAVASLATAVEAMPVKDFDNILLPVSVGALAAALFT